MKERILLLIPFIIIFSVLTIVHVTPEKSEIAKASENKDPSFCMKVKRPYFKKMCFENLAQVKFDYCRRHATALDKKQCFGDVQEFKEQAQKPIPNYFNLFIEALFLTFFSLFILGRAYWNKFEQYIETKPFGRLIYAYRNLQEDSLYFFPRVILGAIFFGFFHYLVYSLL